MTIRCLKGCEIRLIGNSLLLSPLWLLSDCKAACGHFKGSKCCLKAFHDHYVMLCIFTIIRAGGEDSAFSNASIIHQLREQVSQLQVIVQEKEENEKAAAQKLAMYQNQLHAKNNEVATLKDQLQAQVCPKYCQWTYSPWCLYGEAPPKRGTFFQTSGICTE